MSPDFDIVWVHLVAQSKALFPLVHLLLIKVFSIVERRLFPKEAQTVSGLSRLRQLYIMSLSGAGLAGC